MAFARLGAETDERPAETPQDSIPEDREVLISGGADNATRVWDVRGARLLGTQAHPRTVFGVAARHSGGEFATACWDGTVRIFALPSGLLKDHVTTVDWSPTSKYVLASAGWDRKFRLWELSDQEAEACRGRSECSARVAPRWTGRHPQLVWRVAFAPFGEFVAACHGAVGQSPTVVIYEAATGRVVRRLGRHKDTPLAIAWSPDGSLLASAGMDRKVLVYDAFAAQDDMPQGDLDDSEEKEQWLEDLARFRREKKSGAAIAAAQQNSSENGTNGMDPELKIPHPLAGRAAFF